MKILHREGGYVVAVLPGDSEASLIVSKSCWEKLAEISRACAPLLSRATLNPELRRLVEMYQSTKRMLEDVSDISIHFENQVLGSTDTAEASDFLHHEVRKLRRSEREHDDNIGEA